MGPDYDLVCLAHLRWDFVYQRPQHLMSRAAREGRRVFFVEEPQLDGSRRRLDVTERDDGVRVVVPHLPAWLPPEMRADAIADLLNRLCCDYNISRYVLWYYTPMALTVSQHLKPLATVYDCMDELSAFLLAPPDLRDLEAELLRRADLVLTGGRSLYEGKRLLHPHVHLFPSSIDAKHFRAAREVHADPVDQADLRSPRIGFFGVIDERMDLDLVDALALLRPDWQFVYVGPVLKIEDSLVPRRDNIHYLGQKSYRELPAYLSGWDVAIMPFARNESTRFISPTKTLEYLAGGRPVVSTPIEDVVHPYGEHGLVRIAGTPEEFVRAIEAAMAEEDASRLAAVDAILARTSWDRTWQSMSALVTGVVETREANRGRLIEGIPAVFIEQALKSPSGSALSGDAA